MPLENDAQLHLEKGIAGGNIFARTCSPGLGCSQIGPDHYQSGEPDLSCSVASQNVANLICVMFALCVTLGLLFPSHGHAASEQRTLTVEVHGAGSVKSDVGGIFCAEGEKTNGVGQCTATLDLGETVTLTATAGANATLFWGWEKACAPARSNMTCEVSMNDNKIVTAKFSGDFYETLWSRASDPFHDLLEYLTLFRQSLALFGPYLATFLIGYFTVILIAAGGWQWRIPLPFLTQRHNFPLMKFLKKCVIQENDIFECLEKYGPNHIHVREWIKTLPDDFIFERIRQYNREDPKVAKLIKDMITEHEIFDCLTRIRSYHVVTVVMAFKSGEKMTRAVIKGCSAQANEFYGYNPSSERLIGKDQAELLTILQRWMDKDDYDRFLEDQMMLAKDWFFEHRTAFAKVPIRFNNKHPVPEYRNRVFIPMIVGLSDEREIDGEQDQYLTVVYLDVDTLPRELFEK